MAMTIVVGSVFLLLLGLLVVVLWGGRGLREPPAEKRQPDTDSTAQQVRNRAKWGALRRFFWWANVIAFSALVSALLAAWPGGRLVMRILADTSPASAQGRLTEAQALVGFPSLGGTIALLFFGALPAGFLAAVLFPLVRRWLPRGRLAGPLFRLAPPCVGGVLAGSPARGQHRLQHRWTRLAVGGAVCRTCPPAWSRCCCRGGLVE